MLGVAYNCKFNGECRHTYVSAFGCLFVDKLMVQRYKFIVQSAKQPRFSVFNIRNAVQYWPFLPSLRHI